MGKGERFSDGVELGYYESSAALGGISSGMPNALITFIHGGALKRMKVYYENFSSLDGISSGMPNALKTFIYGGSFQRMKV